MNLIILFGPPAVGKMTVGQELAKQTGYKRLHNHMTIDLVTEFFDFGTPGFEALVPELRRMIVREAAKNDLLGLIFTFVWAFDLEKSKAFLDGLRDIVAEHDGRTYYAELEADLEQRLWRNKTENRLRHKKKNDIARSEAIMRNFDENHTMNSSGDFPYPWCQVKINNTHLSPEETAQQFVAAFGLTSAGA